MSDNAVKDSGLPKGWRKSRLHEVASVKTGPFGTQLHQHDYVESNGTPIITVEHLSERGLIHKNLPLVSHHDKQRLSQYLIQEGDIVFSRVGSVDRSVLVKKEEGGWLFSGRLLRVRPNKHDVHSPYLNYFFHTQKFRHHMRSIAVGGIMPSINTSILRNVIVHLPPLDEQKAIASLLETWNTAIEKTETLIAAKQKRFEWLIEVLINKRQYSTEWNKSTLGDLFNIYTYSSKSRLIDNTGTRLIVDMGSISRDGNLIASKRTNSNKDLLQTDDLVMPKDDIGGGNIIGKVTIIALSGKYVCGDHVYRLVQKGKHNAHFLKFLINCNAINRQLRARANGTSQLGLGKQDVLKQQVWLPRLPEQQRIANALNIAHRESISLQQLVKQYHVQKRGLMQKLLVGKLRITKA